MEIFNPEKLLEARVNRLHFFIKTDKLSYQNKKRFVLENSMIVLNSFFGNQNETFWAIIKWFFTEKYKARKFQLWTFWHLTVLRKTNEELEELILKG